MRAYDEINQFEEQLVRAGAVVCKFWLQISKAEQLKRFEAREKTAFKRFKITHGRLAQPEEVGAPTSRRSPTWSTARRPNSRRGRWSRPRTSTSRASRSLKTIVRQLERALD